MKLVHLNFYVLLNVFELGVVWELPGIEAFLFLFLLLGGCCVETHLVDLHRHIRHSSILT